MSATSEREARWSVLDLGDNVVLAWALKKARRDPRTFAVAVLYLGAIYGICAIMSFFWRPSTPGDWDRLFAALHYIGWTANSVLFTLVAPMTFSQQIVQEREKRTMDHLRMTALGGFALAQGNLAAAYALPVLLSFASIPHAIAGCFSPDTGGVSGVFTSYAGLIAASLQITTFVGILSFVPRRTGRATMLVVLGLGAHGLLGFFAWAGRAAGLGILGCLGPGAGLVTPQIDGPGPPSALDVPFLGVSMPAVLLGVPADIILALVLFAAVARKYDDDSSDVVGASESIALTALFTFLAIVTYMPHPTLAGFQRSLVGELAAGRFVVILLVALLIAADNATTYEDLVRGLARAPGEPRRPREQLHVGRSLLAIALVFLVLGLGMSLFLEGSERKLAFYVTAACAASYVGLAALLFQAARLVIPFRSPNVVAGSALAFLWIAPLVASGALETAASVFSVNLPALVFSLPTAFCPFVTVVKAAQAIRPDSLAQVDALSLALVAIFLNVLMGGGLLLLIARAIAQARDFASSLVVLPADAFAAPGALERRCPNGHVYAAKWDRCPHCPS